VSRRGIIPPPFSPLAYSQLLRSDDSLLALDHEREPSTASDADPHGDFDLPPDPEIFLQELAEELAASDETFEYLEAELLRWQSFLINDGENGYPILHSQYEGLRAVGQQVSWFSIICNIIEFSRQ
jgi:hypothetical protein